MKRLWRWIRQQDRVEQLDAERTALSEHVGDLELERELLARDMRSLTKTINAMREAIHALRDVNAELDQRCIDLEKA